MHHQIKTMLLDTTNGHDKAIVEKFNKLAEKFDHYGLLEIILINYCDDQDLVGITELLEERLGQTKQLFSTDYVLYDKANDNVLQDSFGRVILFGDKQEAIEDCRGNEEVLSCTDLPKHWQDIILSQINLVV